MKVLNNLRDIWIESGPWERVAIVVTSPLWLFMLAVLGVACVIMFGLIVLPMSLMD